MLRLLSHSLDQKKSYSGKFDARGTARREKRVREGSFRIPTLWEWDGENSGRVLFFLPKRVILLQKGWENRARVDLLALIPSQEKGYKPADVSHLSRESQAVETFLLQKLHPNSDAYSAPCTWARRERHFHRQKWTLKSVSALVTIRILWNYI